MIKLLLGLVITAYAIQFGVRFTDFFHCHTHACQKRLLRDELEILNVNWQPIVLWPKEAKRFQ